MKKFIVTAICVLLSMAMLAGCGGGAATNQTTASQAEQSASTSAPAPASDEKVTLNFNYWDENQKPGMDKIIEGFQKAHPNITVVGTILPWDQYWTKLQTTLPTGNGPDIFWMNGSSAPDYYKSGLFLDISDKLAKDAVDLSVFPEGLKKLYTFDGKLIGIPKDIDIIGLFYNKELFDKAGVKYPDDTWTWDNLLEAAKKLTDSNSQQFGIGVNSSGQTCSLNFILQNGGKVFSDDGLKAVVNTPENAEAIQFIYDLMFKYKVAPTQAQQSEASLDKLFESGTLAMMMDGAWMVPPYFQALGDKLGVAPLPSKKQKASVLHGLTFVASAKTQHPEEAWQFMKYCASKEAQEAEAGAVIPAYNGTEGAWMQQYPSLDLKPLIASVSSGIPYPQSIIATNASGGSFEGGIADILMQKYDVATGLQKTEQAMNDAIAKGK